jgi:hypothetical protein
VRLWARQLGEPRLRRTQTRPLPLPLTGAWRGECGTMMAARMQRELAQLTSAPPPGVAAWPADGASLQRLTAQLDGPRGSPYEGGVFVLEVRIPDRYARFLAWLAAVKA